MSGKKYYITTTLPYVNGNPHVGFATEIIRADATARYQALMGKEVFFNTGTDEHGQKIYDNAIAAGQTPQEYVNKFSYEFKKLIPALGLMEDIHFIRTTDTNHIAAAQEMWRRCKANGDIYKATQTIRYCVGCELEKTDSELEDEVCPLHPNNNLEIREEENYFFKFSEYQQKLLALYKENPQFVIPSFRQKEIITFVEGGLRDFSVSRLKNKMPWGVAVPDDDDHIMFVWFDALTNYISTTGWPEKEDFDGWWPGTQVAGKDNLRQQTAIWQAMLMSAGLPTSKQVVIGGFINSGGQKMSKSLGNVIAPSELVARYGTDATRYILLRHVHPFDDSDLTWEKMDEYYSADLANGIGNVTSRILAMTQKSEVNIEIAESNKEDLFSQWKTGKFQNVMNVDTGEGGEKMIRDAMPAYLFYLGEHQYIFGTKLASFEYQQSLVSVMAKVKAMDKFIAMTEVYRKNSDSRDENLMRLLVNLKDVAFSLVPFMPRTAEVILEAIKLNKKPENLFARLEN